MEITDRTFDEHVQTGSVLVEFWASWCPPCHVIKKILKKLDHEETGYNIFTLNTDRNLKTASKYNIKGLPCFLILKDGELIHREVGAKSEKQIGAMLTSMKT